MRPRIGAVTDETRWLDAAQQRTWRGLIIAMTLLTERLDDDLRRTFDLSLSEYEILVRLSEGDGTMRMAKLASALGHSRSRVTRSVSLIESKRHRHGQRHRHPHLCILHGMHGEHGVHLHGHERGHGH